jgi:hypothetical protein
MTWDEVHALKPAQLKVSPPMVIPQVVRRGRLLIDLSFAVHSPQGGGKGHDILMPPLFRWRRQ